MKLSKKTKYALKAVLLLAREHKNGTLLQISDIAKRERIPKKFLEAILLTLKNRGILQSRKGKGGGYLLHRAPGSVSIGSVVRIFEGPIAPVPCVSKSAYRKCSECANENTCGIRLVMKEVRDAATGILDFTTLADVNERIDEVSQKEKGAVSYEI